MFGNSGLDIIKPHNIVIKRGKFYGTGYFTRQRKAARSVTLDNLSADWLMTKAIASHKPPAEIISDIIQKEIAAAL